MPTLFHATTLLCFLLCCRGACAQEPEDLVALPPPSKESTSEKYTLETEANKDLEAVRWTPAFLTGSSSTLTDYVRQGRVYSSAEFSLLSTSPDAFQFNEDLVVTPRVSLGWESETGFGVRGSYWNYEQSFTHARMDLVQPLPLTPGQYNRPLYYTDYGDMIYLNPLTQINVYPQTFEAQSLDLEIYQRVVAGQTKLLLGTGLRRIDKSQQFEVERYIPDWAGMNFGYYDTALEKIAGIGGSLVMELEHPLFDAESLGLAVIVGGRTSYIPAEFEVRTSGTINGVSLNEKFDDEFWINDGHVGLELVNRHRYMTLRLRGQFETQYWNSSVTDNQAFTGTSLSCGLDW